MNEILTVSELTSAIKKQLESRFSLVTVRGEISNLKEQSSGHFYFTLKDLEAQISAALFKGTARLLSRLPKGGEQVIVKGELSVYAPRGNYQLIVKELEYQGTGQLLLQLHELKNKLQALGWFDPSRKKKLPKYPKTIGVVTSPTGAVIQDILNVLTRRFSGIHLILNPVKVQGEGAANEIAQAIQQFNHYQLADLLIVGRGGGSLEDLWAFNEESVAKAIVQSAIPIISAVGHETDYAISDFVADIRAPTPSAAAEIAICEKLQQQLFLKQTHEQLSYAVRTRVSQQSQLLNRLKKSPVLLSPYLLLGPYIQKIDQIRSDLDTTLQQKLEQLKLQLLALKKQTAAAKPSNQLTFFKEKLKTLSKAIHTTLCQQIASRHSRLALEQSLLQIDTRLHQMMQEKKQRLQRLIAHLKAIDPKNLLTKGYCILFEEKKDSVILSTEELEAEKKVRILLNGGTALATINEIKR